MAGAAVEQPGACDYCVVAMILCISYYTIAMLLDRYIRSMHTLFLQWGVATLYPLSGIRPGAYPVHVLFQLLALIVNFSLLPLVAMAPSIGELMNVRSKVRQPACPRARSLVACGLLKYRSARAQWFADNQPVDERWCRSMASSRQPLRNLSGSPLRSYAWQSYLLGSPLFKFTLQQLLNCALIGTLATLPPTEYGVDLSSGYYVGSVDNHRGAPMLTPAAVIATSWLLVVVITMFTKCVRDFDAWSSDPINFVEVPGAALALGSLLILLSGSNAAHEVLSPALVLMTLGDSASIRAVLFPEPALWCGQ